MRRQKEQCERQAATLKEQHSALQNYAEEILTLRKDNNIENFSNALETLRQKEQEHQQKEITIKEQRQHLEKLRSDIKVLSAQIAGLENKSSSLTANIENCKKVIAEQTEKFPKTLSINMDFVSEITKNQQRSLKHTEKDYQQSLKELQKKNKELTSCQSTSRSSETHLKQVQELYLTQKKELGFSKTDQPELYYMEEKELTKLEKDITSYYDNLRQNEERIRYLQEKLGKKEIEESEWIRSDIKQQIKRIPTKEKRGIRTEMGNRIPQKRYDKRIRTEFIDNKNGGAIRPSDTLSGGELFITSLSLALALSSSIQLNGAAPLEFFFLDEGFGSLDDDLLDTVMNSLERLQSKKRSIGIISHVETIQARVPLKLLVTPSDLSQKGSQIRLEYS